MRRIAKRYGQIEGVRKTGDRVGPPMAMLRIKSTVRIPPYQSVLYPLEVSETSGTELIVYPQEKTTAECECRVTVEQQVYISLGNPQKSDEILRQGTYVGSYEPVQVIIEPPRDKEEAGRIDQVCTTIKNDLLPHANQPWGGGRKEKLQALLDFQDFSHLSQEVVQT